MGIAVAFPVTWVVEQRRAVYTYNAESAQTRAENRELIELQRETNRLLGLIAEKLDRTQKLVAWREEAFTQFNPVRVTAISMPLRYITAEDVQEGDKIRYDGLSGGGRGSCWPSVPQG
jgi:hypothetical protein